STAHTTSHLLTPTPYRINYACNTLAIVSVRILCAPLVGEPRHGLTADAHDDRARGRQLDAVRLVHSATREANELLDLVATDRPHHRVDDLTRRRRHHGSLLMGGAR